MDILQDAIQAINQKLSHAPESIIPDGKIYRFGEKKSSWYACHEWEFKSKTYHKIIYGDFKLGQEFTWQSYDVKTENDRAFSKAYVNKTMENKIALDLNRQKMNKECREKWHPIFKKADDSIVHSYLKHKGITQNYLSRVDNRDTLLIPLYDHEGFNGVQMIFTDHKTGQYVKRFSTGIKKLGSICPLIPFKFAPIIYISEGFATAASIQMAYPNVPSICALDAGNLIHAINTVRFINPTCKIVIAADKDSNKKGEIEAKKAAKHYHDVIYRVVKFPENSPSEWSDFNDLHNFNSLQMVKDQLEASEDDFSFVQALGHDEDANKYYYISSKNTQVISITGGNHNQGNIARICADVNYWFKRFPKKAREGEEETNGVDWFKVGNHLMLQCQDVGEFDPSVLRGIGVWKDGNSYVWNNGVDVYNKPVISKYLYRKGSKVNLSVKNYSDHEAHELLNQLGLCIKSFKYRNPNDYMILCAWIVQAQIFTVMPWRFWAWLIGDKGTGKSSILKLISEMTPNKVFTTDSTEAGISQTIKSNATCIIYDEIESSVNGKKNMIVDGIMNLQRRLNMNQDGNMKMRGTAGGISSNHNTQACFLFGSIKSNIKNPADLSRIFFIEMDKIGDQDPQEWNQIKKVFEHVIRNKEVIFSYVFKNIDNILENKETISAHLKAAHKMESRISDQLSSMIACYHIFITRAEMILSNDDVDTYLNMFNLVNSNYFEENTDNGDDADAAFDDLMTQIIDHKDQITVEAAIEKLKDSNETEQYKEFFDRLLWTHGLAYQPLLRSLFIANEKRLVNLEHKKADISFYRVLKRSKKYCVESRSLCKNKNTGAPVRGIRIRLDF